MKIISKEIKYLFCFFFFFCSKDFYIVDASEGMVMLVACSKRKNGTVENNLYTSNGLGLKYTKSLPNVVYLNPEIHVKSKFR